MVDVDKIVVFKRLLDWHIMEMQEIEGYGSHAEIKLAYVGIIFSTGMKSMFLCWTFLRSMFKG